MSSPMFYCLKVLISAIFEKRVTDGPTHGRTDRPTDRRTDKASYRDAWTHLKRKKSFGRFDQIKEIGSEAILRKASQVQASTGSP